MRDILPGDAAAKGCLLALPCLGALLTVFSLAKWDLPVQNKRAVNEKLMLWEAKQNAENRSLSVQRHAAERLFSQPGAKNWVAAWLKPRCLLQRAARFGIASKV